MKNFTQNWTALLATSVILGSFSPSTFAADPAKSTILPIPKSITLGAGSIPITAQSRIVVLDPRLEAHASVLQEELWMLTNLKLTKVNADPKAGDIVLKINPEIRADEDILAPIKMNLVKTREMAHTIDVTDRAVVEGWDVRAVCEGTASLLLSIVQKQDQYSIPQMKVKDWPHADYNGTMIDCGRQWMPLDVLKVLVESCRLYKVRYIQLHVGDDQGYSMPSKAFPKLGTQNGSCCEGVPPKLWKWEEMEELEAFAVARGVGIVPELETPGHHQAMARPYRDLFNGPGVMDMASEELYLGLDTVVAEMCGIFKSAPYFCIGCDEANNGAGAGPWAEVYKRRHAIANDAQSVRNGNEIYVVHMKRMADMLKKYGKLTIAYENFPNDSRLKNDIIPMIWYPHSVAHEYQKQGWTTITVPWNEEADWNMYKCNGSMLARTDKVLGASSMMWQMSGVCVANGWAQNVIHRSERTWGPDNPNNNPEYKAIKDASRERADRLVVPVKMTMEGVDGGVVVRAQNFLTGRMVYGGKLKVTLSVANPKFTTLSTTRSPTPHRQFIKSPLFSIKHSCSIPASSLEIDKSAGLREPSTIAPTLRAILQTGNSLVPMRSKEKRAKNYLMSNLLPRKMNRQLGSTSKSPPSPKFPGWWILEATRGFRVTRERGICVAKFTHPKPNPRCST